MIESKAYAARQAGAALEPFTVRRRELGDKDILIDVAYCGICHSDIHQARDEWGGAQFPMVPGHEIAGHVAKVGPKVRKFKTGDSAGVGCMVDSCRACENCKKGLEQHCLKHISFTYNGTEQDQKTPTFGGYCQSIVVDEDFALKIPAAMALERAAPLLCAGITTYSPLKRCGIGPKSRVGVLGLGGLGHMAVKIAAAMGAEVSVLSRSAAKAADAKRLGAQELVLTTDAARAAAIMGRFDAIIDTVSAPHDIGAALSWLRTGGTLALVGASPTPLQLLPIALIGGRRNLMGSLIGGIAETQEMLDSCAKKGALADVEVIAAKDVNSAYERVLRGDVRYRFVIDAKTL